MQKKLEKGTFGYLNRNKIYVWKRAALMLSVPVVIFLAAWLVCKTRENVMTVVAVVGCLPGCNQVVQAIVAGRYHSMEKALYEEIEKVKGEQLVLYENVLTTYEKTYYIDCLVISGREIVGYSSNPKTDGEKAAEHIKETLKKNSYRQNIKIFKEKKAFLERVKSLASGQPETVPFREDDRYPGMDREEIVRHLLMAVSL